MPTVTVTNVAVSATSPKSAAAVSVAPGDILVVFGYGQDGTAVSTPTNSGTAMGAWALKQSNNPGTSSTTSYLWASTATGTDASVVVSATRGTAGSPSNAYGLTMWKVNGSGGLGNGASGAGAGAPSLSLTTTATGSIILFGSGDWNPDTGAAGWLTINGSTGVSDMDVTPADRFYARHWMDAGAAGAKTVGMSGPTGQQWSAVALEVVNTSPVTQTFPFTYSVQSTVQQTFPFTYDIAMLQVSQTFPFTYDIGGVVEATFPFTWDWLAPGYELTDWQVLHEPSALVVGGAVNDVIVKSIKGLRSAGNLRGSDTPWAYADGDIPALNYSGGRTVQFEFTVWLVQNGTEAALNRTATMFQNVRDPSARTLTAGSYLRKYALNLQTPPESSLYVKLPWRTAPVLLLGRPGKYSVPQDRDYSIGHATVSAEWKVLDGLFYDPKIVTGSAGLTSPTGGFSFPKSFPIVFSTVSRANFFTLTNSGTVDGPCGFKITGPVTNPTIVNETTGQSIALNIALVAGDTLWIDCQHATIWLNNQTMRNGAMKWGSQFFRLVPGDNRISFQSTDAAASTGRLYGYGLSAWQVV